MNCSDPKFIFLIYDTILNNWTTACTGNSMKFIKKAIAVDECISMILI